MERRNLIALIIIIIILIIAILLYVDYFVMDIIPGLGTGRGDTAFWLDYFQQR